MLHVPTIRPFMTTLEEPRGLPHAQEVRCPQSICVGGDYKRVYWQYTYAVSVRKHDEVVAESDHVLVEDQWEVARQFSEAGVLRRATRLGEDRGVGG